MRGIPPARLAVAAALEHQVGRRVGGDHDARGGGAADDGGRVVVLPAGHRAHVAGGGARSPAAAVGLLDEDLERAPARVVGLVDVHVDVGVVAEREVEAELDVAARLVEPVLPVRHAADHVGALVHRRGHHLVGARVAPDALLREGDELDLAQAGVVGAGGGDPAQALQGADRVDVDVRADRGRAREHGGADHLAGSLLHLLDRRGALDAVRERDRLGQRARPVRPEQRAGTDLVEVDVRLHERGQDEPAAGVELLDGLQPGADRRDPLAGDRDIDERAVDAGVADDQVVAHQPPSVSTASSKRSRASEAISSISSSRALAALSPPAVRTPSSRSVTTPPGPP